MLRPSKGRPAIARVERAAQLRVEAALDHAEERLVGPRVRRQRALRPAVGALRRDRHVARVGRGGRDRLVEGDRDVRAERLLDGDRRLGGEPVERAVEVAAERHPVVVDRVEVVERDDLESAGVGEDRPVPAHEPVQAAKPLDPLVARPQVEVVRVGQDDLRPDLLEVVGVERLHRRVRPHRHERGRVDAPVGQVESPDAGSGGAVRGRWDEDLEAGGARHGRGQAPGSAGGASSTAGTSPSVAAASQSEGSRSVRRGGIS